MQSSAIKSLVVCSIVITCALAWAQGVQPYPNAITDRLVRPETPMTVPPVNTAFRDPDFGSQLVRATDENTKWWQPGAFFQTPGVGITNAWSITSDKFYVLGQGGVVLAFGFDPSTMAISSLPGAPAGRGLRIPLRSSPTFSFIDPDLIYGTTKAAPLTISGYRFSTQTTSTVIDTTTCGTQPALDPTNRAVTSNLDISGSSEDNRIAISAGGKSVSNHAFVIIYDKKLGCRWYNTQTGQIGGDWGATGYVSVADRYLIGHVHISGDGNYVKIRNAKKFYFWDVATLQVTSCPLHSDLHCSTYGTIGRSSMINGIGVDEMNIAKRPLSDLTQVMPLVVPLATPHLFEQEQHFSWVNGYLDDNAPVCGSVYSYDGDTEILRAWDDEVVCLETDGLASTVWRFAHHRAYMQSGRFNTQPLGNVSADGRFFMFTSTWNSQLGTEKNGNPRSDVFIVKLQ